jgi:hypothetical protein
MALRIKLLCGLLLGSLPVCAQTLGGETVFNFLSEANGPQLSALGGVNVSNISDDLSMAFMQPALLRDSMNWQMVANFNSQYAGVDNYNWMLAHHVPGMNLNFSLGAVFIDYGEITQTDPSGNILGEFRPHDYAIQGTVAGRYLDRWYYGFTMKYIGSDLGQYRSNGLAGDVGLNYEIPGRGWQFGLVAANMGAQLKAYDGVNREEIPFDLRAGVSKRLLNAPFQFSLTCDHIHEWNLTYSDSAYNAAVGASQSEGFAHHLLEHMIFATQLYATKYIEVSLGYSYLLREELSLPGVGNGFTGVSFGVGVLLPQFSFRYARTGYQNNTGYNQIGIDLPFGKR